MVWVTCYSGVNEIGGNQILIEDKEVKFFFDFGTPFGRWNQFYEEFLRPRPGAGLLDPLTMGLLPPVPGLYRTDLEYPQNIWDQLRDKPGFRDLSEANVSGVLLSHAHLDHCGYVSFLRRNIPVYSSAATAFIAKTMQDTGGGTDFEKEICYLNPREPNEDYLASIRNIRHQRKFHMVDVHSLSKEALMFWQYRCLCRARMPTWEAIQLLEGPEFSPKHIGRLTLLSFPVDHSVPGALAYAVETSVGWIGYTGDIRLHGLESQKTREFVERLKDLKPKLLICEGTRIEDVESIPEQVVFENCLQAVKNAEGKLVIADFGARNIERLKIFLEIAKLTDRKLVILAKDAYLLKYLSLVYPEIPSPHKITDIVVYRERKDPDSLAGWERDIRNGLHLVNASEVNRYPGNFMLCFSFWDIKHLIDINVTGGVYIYSSMEVYNEEQAMDLRRLHNWLEAFDFQKVGLPVEVEEGKWEIPEDQKGLHASGHASGKELLDMIKEIKPRVLIPVHTEKPQLFYEHLKGTGIEVRIPIQGQSEVIT